MRTKMKISPAQLAILQGMQKGVTLHSHYVTGNFAPLWSTRSAWTQDYRNYIGRGQQSVLLSTFDALLRQGMIEEETRYKASTTNQGKYTWDTWNINYKLTEEGKTKITE